MRTIPRDPSFEATLDLWRDPYGFITERCERLGTDVFETRLGLRRTICMVGPEAAELFYDDERFERNGALPTWISNVLFGTGGVQGLVGEEHRHRKAMFLEMTSEDRIPDLLRIVEKRLRQRFDDWEHRGSVPLEDELRRAYCAAVCEWADVPIVGRDVERRTREMTWLFEDAVSVGPRYWRAKRARKRLERWLVDVIADARTGRREPRPESALASIVAHRDLEGRPLSHHVAAVELLNLLRPTVAVAGFSVLSALALQYTPEARSRMYDPNYARCFALEIRRFFPFFPMLTARVRHTFDWRGYRFPAGRRVLLDVHGTNHDPRVWSAPDEFRPERYLAREPGAFEYIPQGGGDVARTHRCPGEGIAIALVAATTRLLALELEYDVPPSSLEIDHDSVPAVPANGFMLTRIRRIERGRVVRSTEEELLPFGSSKRERALVGRESWRARESSS